MKKAETVGAIESYTSILIWNLSTKPQNNLREIKEGGNTFICDKEKGRLDLYKSKS